MFNKVIYVFRNVFVRDFIYIFCNYIIAYIPCWTIRKFLYKTLGVKIGKGSRIAMRCIVSRPRKITIGKNTIINEYAILDGRGGLIIGDNNSISMYAKIYTGTHITSSNSFEYVSRETIIEKNCWIGASAIVLPGSHLKDFTVIGANSVFQGKSEEKDVLVGVPAKVVKKRTIDSYYNLRYLSIFR